MRILLFLPAVICFLLPILNGIVQGRREARRQREAAERRRAKAEAAAQAKAEREANAAAKAAEKNAVAAPKRKRGRPRKTPAPAPEAPAPVPPAPEPVQPERSETISSALPFKGNNMFARQTVAFTGTLDGMTRAEAIRAVEANGGKAFETMPASTTILVVGDKPGMGKLDKADRWIGQVRKITQAQFETMLAAPLTLTIDEFAEAFAPRK